MSVVQRGASGTTLKMPRFFRNDQIWKPIVSLLSIKWCTCTTYIIMHPNKTKNHNECQIYRSVSL